jgi:hypothetical protein
VVTLSAETIQTLVGVVVALSGFAVFFDRKIDGLRSELKSDIAALDHKIDRVDDRVFALAIGIKPLIEQAERHESA